MGLMGGFHTATSRTWSGGMASRMPATIILIFSYFPALDFAFATGTLFLNLIE